jgi:hypothetical protein
VIDAIDRHADGELAPASTSLLAATTKDMDGAPSARHDVVSAWRVIDEGRRYSQLKLGKTASMDAYRGTKRE